MAENEAVELFVQEINGVLADQDFAHPNVMCPPIKHKVNGIEFFKYIPPGHTGANLEEADILARGVQFAVRGNQGRTRVIIETPRRGEPQDHLVRTVEFPGLTLYPSQNKTRQTYKLRLGNVREVMKAAKAAFMSLKLPKTVFLRFALACPHTFSMGLWSGAYAGMDMR